MAEISELKNSPADMSATELAQACADELLRRDDADFDTAFDHWRRELMANPWCPDTALQAAAVRLAAEDTAGALARVDEAITTNPNALISYRLQAEILRRRGDTEGAIQAMARFRPETAALRHVVTGGGERLAEAAETVFA